MKHVNVDFVEESARMTANLPESDLLDLREYLFIDEARVRLLTSQLLGGAPSTRVSKDTRSTRLKAGITSVLGAERDSGNHVEETLTLGDLLVSMLEETAEALGVLADLSEHIGKAKAWLRGRVRDRLEPGMLLRVTAPTRLMDTSALHQVFGNFSAAFDDEELMPMLDVIKALYGDNISLSVMPCGPDEPEKAFLGVIGHNIESAALDRSSMLLRLGPETPELTTIMQVSRVPTERDSAADPMLLMQRAMARAKPSPGAESIDRQAIDEAVFQLMRLAENYGLQSAPRWPAVAVTPLAIYRHIPPSLSLDVLSADQ